MPTSSLAGVSSDEFGNTPTISQSNPPSLPTICAQVHDRLEAFLAAHAAVIPRAEVGDLLVFDAGRHFHRVTPVMGARPRWTLGGFVALSRDGSCFFVWN